MNNSSSYFWDTHAHIYDSYYDNIDDIIDKASLSNVKYILNSAVDKDTIKEVLNLSKKYINLYASIGIHPDDVNDFDGDLSIITNNIKSDKVLAIGEIGLDYYYDKSTKKEQINLFESQLKIAEQYNIPVVIHSREATLDTITSLKKFKVKGVIHCFSGSLETALEYINMGFYLGVNGVITFKNSNLKDVIKEIGLNHLVLETDSPYLTPSPNRGKTNEPKNIVDVASFLSILFNISLEDIAKITTENVNCIFDKLH